MPAWNRYSDKSCVTLKQHSRLRKNHSASLVYQVYLVYPALRDETDRMNKTGWLIFFSILLKHTSFCPLLP